MGRYRPWSALVCPGLAREAGRRMVTQGKRVQLRQTWKQRIWQVFVCRPEEAVAQPRGPRREGREGAVKWYVNGIVWRIYKNGHETGQQYNGTHMNLTEESEMARLR